MALIDSLVGTPKRSMFGPGTHTQEFTPIGQRKSSGFQVIHSYPNTQPNLFKPMINNSPHEEEFSQSFFDDNNDDTIERISPVKTNVKYDNKPRSFVNEGGISIKESEERIKELSAENFSWRLKFVELKKYLDSVPKNDRELMLENVELKGEIVNLQKKLQDEKGDVNSEIEKVIQEKNRQIRQLTDQVEEMGKDMHELETRFKSELDQQRYSHEFNDQVQQQIHELEQELRMAKLDVEKLEQEKSQGISTSKKYQQQLDKELEDLHHQHELDTQQISRLQQEISHLTKQQSKITSNDTQLRQERNELLEHERDYNVKLSDLQRQLRDKLDLEQILKSKSNDLERKLSNKSLEISNLETKLQEKSREVINLEKEIKYFQSKTQDDSIVRSKLIQKDNEIDKLKSQLKQVKSSINQQYANQIQELEVERGNLQSQLKDKNSEISKLQSQLKRSSDDEDKIQFYEQEYESIKLELEDKEREVLNFKNRLGKLEQERNELLDKVNSREYSTREMDFKLEQLKEDNEDLERMNRQLKDNVDVLKRELDSMESSNRDLSKIQQENRKLSEELITLEYKLSQYQLENRKLTNELDEINSSYRKLKTEYDSIKPLINSSRQMDELLQDNHMLAEHLENSNKLAEDRSREIRKLELLLEDYKSRSVNDDSISDLIHEISQLKDKLREREIYIDTLIEQLDKSRQDDILTAKLTNSQTLIDNYERKIKLLEDEILSKKSSEQSPIEAVLELKYQAANEKVNNLTQQITELTARHESNKSIISKLEHEKQSLQDELSLVQSQHKQLTREKDRLLGQVSTLDEDLERMTRSCRLMSLKAHDYKQAILKKSSSSDYQDKLNILERETIYYRAKLRDVMLRANDFRMMYTYTIASIKGTNSLYDGESNLARLGIYPEYVGNYKHQRKLTFKSVAVFVLASIRLKNRTRKSKVRTKELKALKQEVECGKIQFDM